MCVLKLAEIVLSAAGQSMKPVAAAGVLPGLLGGMQSLPEHDELPSGLERPRAPLEEADDRDLRLHLCKALADARARAWRAALW
jgi:hypothetical protein